MRPPYPFSALVGQDLLCDGLLVNAVLPEVGGLLVRGERGAAKSTAVRSLAPLLPPIPVLAGHPFPYAPGERSPLGQLGDGEVERRQPALVELPLGATLDRLLGSIDLERAVAGEVRFQPGLLAQAHRGILYVDEVNLLPDHLVDALLDAAASGVARVEREGVSVVHDARFLLVGTMNVEEGELRPQLSDRFGLCVEVKAPAEVEVRVEILRRRLAYERDPERFAASYRSQEETVRRRLGEAQARVGRIDLRPDQLRWIGALCARLGIEGMRGDIACGQAARALAALGGRDEVSAAELERGALLALPHRLRRDPMDGGQGREEVEAALRPGREQPPAGGEAPPEGEGEPDPSRLARPHTPNPLFIPFRYSPLLGRFKGAGTGRQGKGERGAEIDSAPARGGRISLPASLRAKGVGLESPRDAVEAGRGRGLLLLIVDGSGSMGARRRLAMVKGALEALLREAHARREQVAVISFGGRGPRLLCPPGTPLERVRTALDELPAQGRTDLAQALALAREVALRERRRGRRRGVAAFLFSDGRAPSRPAVLAAAARLRGVLERFVVVDLERGAVRVGLCRAVAATAGGLLVEGL